MEWTSNLLIIWVFYKKYITLLENIESKDDVEMKIITPSVYSDNDGLAEYYYNRVVGAIDENFVGYFADEALTAATIKSTFEDCNYLEGRDLIQC